MAISSYIYKIEKNLEPKDNITSGDKKKVILKSRSSNNKDFYELVKKREDYKLNFLI